MDPKTRNAAIAAAAMLIVFGLVAYMMPAIMRWLGDISPVAAGAFVALFILAPFIVLWLRARSQRDKE